MTKIRKEFGETGESLAVRYLQLSGYEIITTNYQTKPGEIDIIARDGETIVALTMYWKASWVKIKIGTARGKKLHDKRSDSKDRDWQRDKARIMKHSAR